MNSSQLFSGLSSRSKENIAGELSRVSLWLCPHNCDVAIPMDGFVMVLVQCLLCVCAHVYVCSSIN